MTFPIPTLTTERFSVQLWTPEDISDLLDLDDDPDVIAYVGPVPDRAQRSVEWHGLIDTPQARPCLVIRSLADGAFQGWAFLRPFRDDSGDWELGYRLQKSAWGQGIGSEVANALFDWGVAQPDINVIGAVYETPNVASRAIMIKLGMVDAGTRHYFRDEILPYCEWRRV